MKTYAIYPSASRLINSLRDIGYDFNTAVADLVDNSIAAGAAHVQIEIRHNGDRSSVMVIDDGAGMSEATITEALRYGSQRTYLSDDLGRFGLGLKTASMSQCRRLTVLSRRSSQRIRIAARQLDLDLVGETDRWEVTDPERVGNVDRAADRLRAGPGTAVVWENLDRVFGSVDPNGGWAKRRLAKLTPQLEGYLGMVFHRFLSGEVPGREILHISVNGEKVRSWNPFAPDEEKTIELLPLRWEIEGDLGPQAVKLARYVLPPRERFSSQEEFDRLAGPMKWNRQQGLYIYRSHRLIQGGGWGGIRTLDEHTKLARASLDFPAALDELFHVNVAKMRVLVPPEVRSMLESPVNELCREADSIYRSVQVPDGGEGPGRPQRTGQGLEGAALAIRAAAMVAGISDKQFNSFSGHLRENNPEVAALIGL
jgi:hypothetical protein